MSRISGSVWIAIPIAAACGGRPAAPKAAPEEPAPRGEETLKLERASREDGVLLRGAVDLDGDGRAESIVLSASGVRPSREQHDRDPRGRITVPIPTCEPAGEPCAATLTVGELSLPLSIRTGYFGGIGIEVIDIDRSDGRKELLLTQRGESDEDPWYEFSVVIHDGSRLYLHELWHSSGYNSGAAFTSGDGTLVLSYDECPDSTTVAYRLQGTRFVEADRRVVRTRDPSTCAACPYVYLFVGGEPVKQGEILRNLNREALREKQSLRLASGSRVSASGFVTVELREEKDEITFLDEIYLEVDGVAVAPSECDGEHAFCAADEVYHLLRRGDTLRLTFPVGEGDPASLRLYAVGYYLPE